jgi:SAM-dependent methyltransferase
MSNTPWWNAAKMTGDDYDAKFVAFERTGQDVHGEANLIDSLGVSSVLDAGCGTGRVAIELARRGLEVVGVDRDQNMLRVAWEKAPHVSWYLENLVDCELRLPDVPHRLRVFEAIVLAGNVMLYLDVGTEAAVVANLARHLVPGGLLVAGFQLMANGFSLEQYDTWTAQAGLACVERWATWDRQPWHDTSDYAVSIHRRLPTE